MLAGLFFQKNKGKRKGMMGVGRQNYSKIQL